MLSKPKMNPGYCRLWFLPCDAKENTLLGLTLGAGRLFSAQLDANGWTLADVVLVHLYVASMDDFAPLNTVYKKHFGANPPAR